MRKADRSCCVCFAGSIAASQLCSSSRVPILVASPPSCVARSTSPFVCNSTENSAGGRKTTSPSSFGYSWYATHQEDEQERDDQYKGRVMTLYCFVCKCDTRSYPQLWPDATHGKEKNTPKN
jgi:hypothetical protein